MFFLTRSFKISKKREAKLPVEVPDNFYLGVNLCFAFFNFFFDSPRFASAHYLLLALLKPYQLSSDRSS